MDTKSAQEIINWLEENQETFTGMSDQIWATPEVAWYEFKSSRLQADHLEKEGITITWDVGGLNTAFMAEWGQGQPILGFIGEYDALPGLSQKKQPTQEPLEEGGNGHGCRKGAVRRRAHPHRVQDLPVERPLRRGRVFIQG